MTQPIADLTGYDNAKFITNETTYDENGKPNGWVTGAPQMAGQISIEPAHGKNEGRVIVHVTKDDGHGHMKTTDMIMDADGVKRAFEGFGIGGDAKTGFGLAEPIMQAVNKIEMNNLLHNLLGNVASNPVAEFSQIQMDAIKMMKPFGTVYDENGVPKENVTLDLAGKVTAEAGTGKNAGHVVFHVDNNGVKHDVIVDTETAHKVSGFYGFLVGEDKAKPFKDHLSDVIVQADIAKLHQLVTPPGVDSLLQSAREHTFNSGVQALEGALKKADNLLNEREEAALMKLGEIRRHREHKDDPARMHNDKHRTPAEIKHELIEEGRKEAHHILSEIRHGRIISDDVRNAVMGAAPPEAFPMGGTGVGGYPLHNFGEFIKPDPLLAAAREHTLQSGVKVLEGALNKPDNQLNAGERAALIELGRIREGRNELHDAQYRTPKEQEEALLKAGRQEAREAIAHVKQGLGVLLSEDVRNAISGLAPPDAFMVGHGGASYIRGPAGGLLNGQTDDSQFTTVPPDGLRGGNRAGLRTQFPVGSGIDGNEWVRNEQDLQRGQTPPIVGPDLSHVHLVTLPGGGAVLVGDQIFRPTLPPNDGIVVQPMNDTQQVASVKQATRRVISPSGGM